MPYTTFEYSVTDAVAHVRFNRPEKANAMILPFWQEMVDVFREIEDTVSVRAVVISSTGRHFTAGLDLRAFGSVLGELGAGDRGRASERLRRTVKEMQASFDVIDKCRVPVLAAIQGGCIGGGVDLISACDTRYCTEDAWFVIQEINIGMVADVGTLQRLPRLIPHGVVRDLAYTGRKMHAEEAQRWGLVNGVFPTHEALVAHVLGVAREIAAKSPLAIAGTKQVLNFARDHSLADGLDHIALWNAGMLLGNDLMEQMGANMEKRAAVFEDLLPSTHVVKLR